MYRVDAKSVWYWQPNSLLRPWGVTALAFVLTACGGGGGGGSSSPPPTPPAPTYVVSGTVSGLTNPAVLQVSGAADITVSANGSVTLLTGVASGTSYTVTVRTQPSSPRQECTVTNGAGTVSGNISNVAIECVDVPLTLSSSTPMHAATAAARGGDIVLTFSLPLDANVPPAAVTLRNAAAVVPTSFTTNGNQIIVTPSQRLLPVMAHTLTVGTQVRGTGGEQMPAPAVVSFMTEDGAWGQAEIIEATPQSLPTPQLAVRANGEAIAIWQDTSLGTNLHQTVTANRYVAGAGWDALPRHIAYSAGGGTIDGLRIALSDRGDAIAVWEQDDDGSGTGVPSIGANRRAVGADWNSNNAALIESGTFRAGRPQIALDSHGNGVAVWQQYDGNGDTDIWARRYLANSGWGAPTLIATTNTSQAVLPEVAVADNGDAIVVWQQLDGGFYSVWANRFAAGSGWSGAVLIESHDGHANNPSVEMSATGDAIVIWQSHNFSGDRIWANQYVVGRGWDDAVMLGTSTSALHPRVAIDANGNAIAVWYQAEGLRYSIWSSRYVASQGWDDAALLETDDSGDARGVQIAFDPRGNALAVWEQEDGTRTNIWARRYVAGSAWLAPMLIESNDAGDANGPQIGFDADGNAIAVWRQDDGQRFNIWANRFE